MFFSSSMLENSGLYKDKVLSNSLNVNALTVIVVPHMYCK